MTCERNVSKGEALRSLLHRIEDDVIFWRNLGHHKQHLRQSAGRLRDNEIKCYLSKVRERFLDEDCLEHKVVSSGTALRTIQVKTIVNVLPPTNIPE
jgi:hypothetical protein